VAFGGDLALLAWTVGLSLEKEGTRPLLYAWTAWRASSKTSKDYICNYKIGNFDHLSTEQNFDHLSYHRGHGFFRNLRNFAVFGLFGWVPCLECT